MVKLLWSCACLVLSLTGQDTGTTQEAISRDNDAVRVLLFHLKDIKDVPVTHSMSYKLDGRKVGVITRNWITARLDTVAVGYLDLTVSIHPNVIPDKSLEEYVKSQVTPVLDALQAVKGEGGNNSIRIRRLERVTDSLLRTMTLPQIVTKTKGGNAIVSCLNDIGGYPGISTLAERIDVSGNKSVKDQWGTFSPALVDLLKIVRTTEKEEDAVLTGLLEGSDGSGTKLRELRKASAVAKAEWVLTLQGEYSETISCYSKYFVE